jgi:hypothetical protein
MSLTAILMETGLGVYTEKFKTLGTSLDTVLELSPADLDALVHRANMLKGHAVKFKKCIGDLKKTSPDKRPKQLTEASSSVSAPEPVLVKPENRVLEHMHEEIARSFGVLHSIAELKLGLSNFRETILQFEVESYMKAIDDIEDMQKYYTALGLVSSMDIES